MNLFESFTKNTKSDWIEKIKIDLKGRDIGDLNVQVTKNLETSPFKHHDDIISETLLPRPTTNGTSLGLSIHVHKEDEANSLILEALEGGVSFVEFIIEREDKVNFKVLLNGIMLELIEARFCISTKSNVEHLREFLVVRYFEEVINQISIFTTTGNSDYSPTIYIGACDIENDHSMIEVLNKGAEVLESNNKTGKTVFVKMNFGHNYVQNIASIRALRLLWANLCAAHDLLPSSYPFKIEGYISEKAVQRDRHDNMIAFTQIAMSMMSGGIDIMFLNPSDVYEKAEGTPFSRRISRNIYQLMTLEGHMNIVSDPVSGSYLFDSISADLAKGLWALLIKDRIDE